MSKYRKIADLEAVEGKIVQGRSEDGLPLCKFCSKEVKAPRRVFCSNACAREWELRSNPNFLKKELYRLQKGVCQSCGLDCVALAKYLRSLSPEERKIQVMILNIPPHRLKGRLWDCDHKIPVAFGGGIEMDQKPMIITDFVQTLCVICHLIKTKEMMPELKKLRRSRKRNK